LRGKKVGRGFNLIRCSNMLLNITAQPQAVPRGERLNIEDGEREAVTRREGASRILLIKVCGNG